MGVLAELFESFYNLSAIVLKLENVNVCGKSNFKNFKKERKRLKFFQQNLNSNIRFLTLESFPVSQAGQAKIQP